MTDPLTELANRRRFMSALATELQRAQRFEVSRSRSSWATSTTSSSSTTPSGTRREILGARGHPARAGPRHRPRSRLGGEEFAILLPETDLSGGERLGERLRDAIERLRVPGAEGVRVSVTASFGVAAFPESSSAGDLLAAADAALYSAKLHGKNRVVAGSAA